MLLHVATTPSSHATCTLFPRSLVQERHDLAQLEGADRLRARTLQRAMRVAFGDMRNLGLWVVLGAALVGGWERARQAFVVFVVLRATMHFTFSTLKSLVA